MIGVYFLYLNKELQYIGQSKQIDNRIKQHKIKYDFIGIIICSQDELLSLEREMIKTFRPKYNKDTGGKRIGAGRKSGDKAFKNVKKKEDTVVVRVRVSKLDQIKKINSEK